MTSIYRKLLSKFINHDVMHLTQVMVKKPGASSDDIMNKQRNGSRDSEEGIFAEDGAVQCLA